MFEQVIWGIHPGKGGAAEDLFIRREVIAIGWPAMGDLSQWSDREGYKRSIEESGFPTFFRAEYVCEVDWDLCTGCKGCMAQCQFGAQFYSSVLSKVYIDPARCYGCGVCRSVCPHEAIALLPRQEHPEAAELWLR